MASFQLPRSEEGVVGLSPADFVVAGALPLQQALRHSHRIEAPHHLCRNEKIRLRGRYLTGSHNPQCEEESRKGIPR